MANDDVTGDTANKTMIIVAYNSVRFDRSLFDLKRKGEKAIGLACFFRISKAQTTYSTVINMPTGESNDCTPVSNTNVASCPLVMSPEIAMEPRGEYSGLPL